jgi:hypothetical protein
VERLDHVAANPLAVKALGVPVPRGDILKQLRSAGLYAGRSLQSEELAVFRSFLRVSVTEELTEEQAEKVVYKGDLVVLCARGGGQAPRASAQLAEVAGSNQLKFNRTISQ